MKFLIIALMSVLSFKSYAQYERPQYDWEYQQWKKKSNKQKSKKTKARRYRRRLPKSLITRAPRAKVLSRAKISKNKQVYGWDSSRLQASVGYGAGSIVSAESYAGGTNGLRVDIGSHFDINENWTASSFARVHYDIVDSDSLNAPFGLGNIDAKAYDLGIAQRFLYKVHAKKTTVSPFIEGHVGRGFFDINESQQLTSGSTFAKTQFQYVKASGAVGLQFEYDDLLPFVKFEYGIMVFDDVVSYEVTEVNGNNRSGDSFIENSDSLNYTFNTISAGISYLF